MSLEAIVGALFTVCLGALSFLLVRLIKHNDVFQDDTRKSIILIRSSLAAQAISIKGLEKDISEKIERCGFDEKTKAKMSSLLVEIAKIQRDLQEMKPVVEKAVQNHGKIIFIEDRVKAQDKKIKSLFDIMQKLASLQKR